MSEFETESTVHLLNHSDLFDTRGDSDSDTEKMCHRNSCSPSSPVIERNEPKVGETPPKSSRKQRQPRKSAERATRMTKASVIQMHSESQRMVRESRVSLPSYQPKVKTLDCFLTRLKSRTPVDNHKEVMRKVVPSKAGTAPLPVAGVISTIATRTDQQMSTDIQNEATGSHSSSVVPDPNNAGKQTSVLAPLDSSSDGPATHCKEALSFGNDHSILSTCSLTPLLKGPSTTTVSFLPKLSSVGEWKEDVIEPSSSSSNLSAVELFQQRFLRHAKPQHSEVESASSATPKTYMSVEGDNQHELGNAPCVPQEVAKKLANKPGAIRKYLKDVLSRRLSLQKAEERKRAEEVRRMDNEEVEPGNLSEMEAELSDEEYEDETDSAEEEEEEERDCGIKEAEADPVPSDCDASDKQAEESCSSGVSGQSEGSDSDDDADDDDDNILPVSRQLNFSLRRSRVIGSDDETSSSMSDTEASPLKRNLREEQPREPCKKESMPTDLPRNTSTTLTQEFATFFEEATMGPLLFNDSLKNRDELTNNQFRNHVEQGSRETTTSQEKLESNVVDSSVGMVMEDTSSSQQTQLLYEEKEEGEDNGSVDGDSSFNEMTFFGHSLAPAQELRREDSEELFTPATMSRQDSVVSSRSDKDESTQSSLVWQQAPTQSLSRMHFRSVLDEETQFLDADGYLCNRATPKSISQSIHKVVEDSNEVLTQDLLALCSGQFVTQKRDAKMAGHCQDLLDATSSNVVGALGRQLDLPSKEGRRRLSTEQQGTMSSDGDIQDSSMSEVLGLQPQVLSAGITTGPRRSLLAGQRNSFGASGSASSEEDDDAPLLIKRKRKFRPKPKPTKGERLQEFVESEAELSGSEGVSADEEEVEGENEYEEDEGAELDVPDSDTELRRQVNKAHMRQLLADDKADVREFKERFLVEGDLCEDGVYMRNGFFRTRRFAHDSEASMDLFAEDRQLLSCSDKEDEDTMSSQVEAQRRKERLEKEDFLRRCRQRECSLLSYEEDSQSILGMINESSCPPSFRTPESSSFAPEVVPTSSSKRSRCGSFLKHGSTALQRLSSYTATTPNINSNKAFIFQADSSSRDKSYSGNPKAKEKASTTIPNKRPRLEGSVSHTDSIFNQLIK